MGNLADRYRPAAKPNMPIVQDLAQKRQDDHIPERIERHGAAIVYKKGRPSTGTAKPAITIRLDQDIVVALQSREDWRSEVNDVLRRHLGL